MSILNAASGKIDAAKSFIKNPLSFKVEPTLDKPDFDGFYIEEVLENGNGEIISLIGNMMPKIPFKFGGGQRLKKEFYAGNSEPVIQVKGSEEDDVTITGEFKEKNLTRDLKGVAQEMQEQVDAMRLRGNVVKIRMGEWERYAMISKVSFEMTKLAKIEYSITFMIFGFYQPTNARFLADTREIPYDINNALIDKTAEFNRVNSQIPASVPASIGDLINQAAASAASAMALVTGFVDSVLATVNDIKKAVTRCKGMIKFAQKALKTYKSIIGNFKPFNDFGPLDSKYGNARFYASTIALAASITRLLESLRRKIESLTVSSPLGRHLVVAGDSLQKISVKFYGSPDNWKKIYDYNDLKDTALLTGTFLEIPRL